MPKVQSEVSVFNAHASVGITAAMTEDEELTQRKSNSPDRVLRVHRIVLARSFNLDWIARL